MEAGSARPYNITKVSVDVSQLTPKQLIGLPPAEQIDADLTRALRQQLATASDKSGQSAIFVLQVNEFTLGDSGNALFNSYSVSKIWAIAEIRDARSQEVLVPGGRVFSATPRGNFLKFTGAQLSGNPDKYKTRQQDYRDTIDYFAATVRKNIF